MKKLIYDYRKEEFVISKNFDRISMLVSLYYLLYYQYLQNIQKSKFYILSKKVETISNMMVYVEDLLDRKKEIVEIPYLDELIVSTDNYIMDREKDFSLFRRILKR